MFFYTRKLVSILALTAVGVSYMVVLHSLLFIASLSCGTSVLMLTGVVEMGAAMTTTSLSICAVLMGVVAFGLGELAITSWFFVPEFVDWINDIAFARPKARYVR